MKLRISRYGVAFSLIYLFLNGLYIFAGAVTVHYFPVIDRFFSMVYDIIYPGQLLPVESEVGRLGIFILIYVAIFYLIGSAVEHRIKRRKSQN